MEARGVYDAEADEEHVLSKSDQHRTRRKNVAVISLSLSKSKRVDSDVVDPVPR